MLKTWSTACGLDQVIRSEVRGLTQPDLSHRLIHNLMALFNGGIGTSVGEARGCRKQATGPYLLLGPPCPSLPPRSFPNHHKARSPAVAGFYLLSLMLWSCAAHRQGSGISSGVCSVLGRKGTDCWSVGRCCWFLTTVISLFSSCLLELLDF